MNEPIGVADAKRRFAELADRVGHGESFTIVNRGRPVLALVPPHQVAEDDGAPTGLAAAAGILAEEWVTVEDDMLDVVASRARTVDRPAPDLE